MVVIDLVRMPCYGRWMGSLLRGHQAARKIPLVLVEGDPEKARLVRRVLPDAVFTGFPRIGPSLEKAIRTALAEPMA
ncbi:MAG TPA: hypothetical protein VE959_17965 [Bryobacteraceae bacterium]|nr:hypothetical protein [Bryobacteraceae bacterium]